MKDKLTLQMALENKFNATDCIKYYWPDMPDGDADYMLWNETCFPFDNEIMLTQIYNKYLKEQPCAEHTEQSEGMSGVNSC